MGKLTDALKKAAQERFERLEKQGQQSEVKYEFIARKTVDSKIDPRIAAFYEPESPITEQYRTLRTNLLALNIIKPPKTIIITSSTHSEGKTITSINLAISMAHDMDKKSILLVDADLRRSKIGSYLGVNAELGLSDLLTNDTKLDDALLSIGIDNLTILPAGKKPKNPAELLGSLKMKKLLSLVKDKYDYVIFDTPPIIPVTDAGILGPQTDGVVMVIQAGRTQKAVVHRSQQLLKQAQAKLLGCILTNIQYHIPAYIYRYL
ncbi:MAG: CpsD/CapB family tyrosine-protein kinase [Candidatus Omnitrophota bacterium]